MYIESKIPVTGYDSEFQELKIESKNPRDRIHTSRLKVVDSRNRIQTLGRTLVKSL